MIDVCLLGTCGMMPMPGRWLSCGLVRCGSNLVLIDCGEGTQVPWKTLGWGFRQLGAICLTHMHADHVAGLPGVLFMVAHAGRTEPLEIYGPAGTTYVIEGLHMASRVWRIVWSWDANHSSYQKRLKRWACPYSSGPGCSTEQTLSTMGRCFTRNRCLERQGAASHWP